MMSTIDTTKTVLIVGAGPVGLTLTNDLLRRGVSCRVIDKAPQATQKTKALAIQPRTLELLAKIGVADLAVQQGLKTTKFNPYSDGKCLAHIDYADYLHDTQYPYMSMLPQNQTEALLTAHLQRQHGVIEWKVELVNFTQDEQGVEVVLRHADGKIEQTHVGWLVGCDGAHSMVRHLLGLNFTGTSFEQSFAVGNVHMTWDLPYDEIQAFVHQGSFIAYFPMVGQRHRVVIAYELDKAPTGDVTLEEIQQVIDVCGPHGARADTPTDLARFHVNQRRTEQYAQGRVFLAGDAAHIHSPIGGQGMNTGMQDAFNLSWKLALVAKGQAPQSLLESYDVEREEVGKELLRGTGLATRMVLTRNPFLVTLRNHLAPIFLSSVPVVLKRLVSSLSEIGVAYQHSSIILDQRENKGVLHAGDRAPDGSVQVPATAELRSLSEILQTTRSVLLLFTGQQKAPAIKQGWQSVKDLLSEGYADMIEAYPIIMNAASVLEQEDGVFLQDLTGDLHHLYTAEQGGLVLIRPDGYIGFWGSFTDTDGLRNYVQKLFIASKA